MTSSQAYQNNSWTSVNLIMLGDNDFHTKLTQMLDQIYSIPLGKDFLQELDACGHKITNVLHASISPQGAWSPFDRDLGRRHMR